MAQALISFLLDTNTVHFLIQVPTTMEIKRISQLKIHSALEFLDKYERFMHDVIDPYPQYAKRLGAIIYVTNEIVNNAIKHGNRHDPDKYILINVEVSNVLIRISVQDQGDGFVLSSIPDPTLPSNREKLAGRGVYIIQNYADRVEYIRSERKVIVEFYPSEIH